MIWVQLLTKLDATSARGQESSVAVLRKGLEAKTPRAGSEHRLRPLLTVRAQARKVSEARPTLLVTPQRDAEATYADVAHAIDSVASAWPAAGALTRIADGEGPSSTSEFGRVQIDTLVEWLGNVTGTP